MSWSVSYNGREFICRCKTFKKQNNMRQEIERKLTGLLMDKFGIEAEDVTNESRFKSDFEFDSLDRCDLIVEVESAFSISIEDEEAEEVKTVGEAIDLIEAKLKTSKE